MIGLIKSVLKIIIEIIDLILELFWIFFYISKEFIRNNRKLKIKK